MKRGTMVALGIIVLLVAGGIGAILALNGPGGGPRATATTTRPVATATTHGPGSTTAISTTSLPTTTQMSITTTTTPVQTITENSPTGPTVWHSGDGIPPAGDGYEGYYCCKSAVPRRRGPERQRGLFREHAGGNSGRGVLSEWSPLLIPGHLRGGPSPSRPSPARWGR